ncbi:MAG: hypothetical protein V3571_12025 [Pseudodesulfovibrio sp.]
MRGIITTLLLLAVPACICGKLFGPTDELSTWQWVVFAMVAILSTLVILLLAGLSDSHEGSEEDHSGK